MSQIDHTIARPERPIQTAAEDALGREGFVRRLASALIDNRAQKATGVVIGITGQWGSGKSSALNLLAEHLQNTTPKPIVVRFDPWLISGRNDLISEFLSELVSAIKAQSHLTSALKTLARSLTDYGSYLAPFGNMIAPWAGTAAAGAIAFVKRAVFHETSIAEKRRTITAQLSSLPVPIVVLIDELDRIEDHEVRVIAQLVRSVADFPNMSYVLAYDPERVARALGFGETEEKERDKRGRAYLEKIVQLQIPLPLLLGEELERMLGAELTALQSELRLPENFRAIERYQKLVSILTLEVVRTPRDVGRLMGTFHALRGMLLGEVDWLDLLAYCALLVKAPATISNLRRYPDEFVKDGVSVQSILRRMGEEKKTASARLHEVIAASENEAGVRALVQFLFPDFADHPRYPGHPDALYLRRPLLTTMRLGLIPGGYGRSDIERLIEQSPDELERSLRSAYSSERLEALLDRLNELYITFDKMDHLSFWTGVAQFLRKSDCTWVSSYEPMHEVVREFSRILPAAISIAPPLNKVAARIFSTLIDKDENVLTAAWLRSHVFKHGLFGNKADNDKCDFLNATETEYHARTMSSKSRVEHLLGKLIPCRWELNPVYTMIDTGVWDDACRAKVNEDIKDDSALDGLTLMLYGRNFMTGVETVAKICSVDLYRARVKQRLETESIERAHETVRLALGKAADPWP